MIKYSSQFGNLTKQRNVERAVESGLLPSQKDEANECDGEGVRSLGKVQKEACEDKERGS